MAATPHHWQHRMSRHTCARTHLHRQVDACRAGRRGGALEYRIHLLLRVGAVHGLRLLGLQQQIGAQQAAWGVRDGSDRAAALVSAQQRGYAAHHKGWLRGIGPCPAQLRI
jgi:hypothetical protein